MYFTKFSTNHYILSAVVLIILLFTGINNRLQAQDNKKPFDIGIELQAYPTGLLSGIHLEKGFGQREAINLRIGHNFIRHRDLGVHEDERGGGFGFTLGYRHYFSPTFSKFFAGIRSDLWFNKVNWKDNIGTLIEFSGTSNIVVLQPTLEGGYLFLLGQNEDWFLAPSLAFGFEINIANDGADVGQGPIILLGFSMGKRF